MHRHLACNHREGSGVVRAVVVRVGVMRVRVVRVRVAQRCRYSYVGHIRLERVEAARPLLDQGAVVVIAFSETD
jgi:hypothetical protein